MLAEHRILNIYLTCLTIFVQDLFDFNIIIS